MTISIHDEHSDDVHRKVVQQKLFTFSDVAVLEVGAKATIRVTPAGATAFWFKTSAVAIDGLILFEAYSDPAFFTTGIPRNPHPKNNVTTVPAGLTYDNAALLLSGTKTYIDVIAPTLPFNSGMWVFDSEFSVVITNVGGGAAFVPWSIDFFER